MSLPHSQRRGSFQVRPSRLSCCESLQSVLSFTQAPWLVDLHHLEDDLSSPKLAICNHLSRQSLWQGLHEQRCYPLLQPRKPLWQFLNCGRLHIESSDGVTSQPLLITLSGHGHQIIPPPHCTVTDISNLWTNLCHPVTSFKTLIFSPQFREFRQSDGHRLELFLTRPIILNSTTQGTSWVTKSTSLMLTYTLTKIPKLASLLSKLVSSHGKFSLLMKIWIPTVHLDPVAHVDVIASLTKMPLSSRRISSWRSHSLEWLRSICTQRFLTRYSSHSQSFAKFPEFLLKSLNPLRFGIWYLLDSPSSAIPEAMYVSITLLSTNTYCLRSKPLVHPRVIVLLVSPKKHWWHRRQWRRHRVLLHLVNWRWSIWKLSSTRSDFGHIFGLAVCRCRWGRP